MASIATLENDSTKTASLVDAAMEERDKRKNKNEREDDDMFLLWMFDENRSLLLHTILSSSDEDSDADNPPYAHTRRPRSKRIQFDHAGSQYCILRDYLGPTPKFTDKAFQEMFRISKSRMQRLLEDIGNAPPELSDFFLRVM